MTMTTCRFYVDDGDTFTYPVETIPSEGDTVELAGQSFVVRRVNEIPGPLRPRFGHAAVVFCAPEDAPIA